MHEMALTESLIEIAIECAEKNGAAKIQMVCVEIGALSMIELDALKFCFDIVAKDTLAEGARLEAIIVPGEGLCKACGRKNSMTERFGVCNACGSAQLRLTGGTEFRLKQLEIV